MTPPKSATMHHADLRIESAMIDSTPRPRCGFIYEASEAENISFHADGETVLGKYHRCEPEVIGSAGRMHLVCPYCD